MEKVKIQITEVSCVGKQQKKLLCAECGTEFILSESLIFVEGEDPEHERWLVTSPCRCYSCSARE
jgi:hypothetical protein